MAIRAANDKVFYNVPHLSILSERSSTVVRAFGEIRCIRVDVDAEDSEESLFARHRVDEVASIFVRGLGGDAFRWRGSERRSRKSS